MEERIQGFTQRIDLTEETLHQREQEVELHTKKIEELEL